ncbi:hypothetical protein B0T14DRAFT_565736 [Immersiella caudata]|uniref:Rhodanese domain-containing protein n=1 Tax=Immersiella caudata TaxID=314043 RepID=A0AA39WNU0_9PEZI|nr:hypothetical protein B0T14DRAFT_565736 [Immersiella caudata]
MSSPSPRVVGNTWHLTFLVDKEYVRARLNRKNEHIYLIGGRAAGVYNGSVLEDWKSPLKLLAQPRGAVGYGVSRSYGETIVYCGVGGYASTWYFVLPRVLGFDNVKIYDGSAQEWSRYYDMEL